MEKAINSMQRFNSNKLKLKSDILKCNFITNCLCPAPVQYSIHVILTKYTPLFHLQYPKKMYPFFEGEDLPLPSPHCL